LVEPFKVVFTEMSHPTETLVKFSTVSVNRIFCPLATVILSSTARGTLTVVTLLLEAAWQPAGPHPPLCRVLRLVIPLEVACADETQSTSSANNVRATGSDFPNDMDVIRF